MSMDRWRQLDEVFVEALQLPPEARAPFVERANRPPLAIVMAPTEGQLQAFARGADPAQVMYPQLRLQAFCAHEELACIDLAEAFAGSTAEELSSYYLDDLHFSEAGHAVVARFLWPRIKAMIDKTSQ